MPLKSDNNLRRKPFFERISPQFGTSIYVNQNLTPSNEGVPFWHRHPEIELVYINGGSGRRHIGNHLSYFQNGDLILMGSNLPHSGFKYRLTGNKLETLVQVKPDFLGHDFFDIPEMEPVKQLLEKAKLGISFHGKTKRHMGAKVEKLARMDPFDKLLGLLAIFKQLAISQEYTILNAQGYAIETRPEDNDRINKVFDLVSRHYTRPISLEEVADIANLTVPSFCRYFKNMTGKTFVQYANEYRIVNAIKLLSERPLSIAEVAMECGFNNFSHFNKSFKQVTGKSPSEYRKHLKLLIRDRGPEGDFDLLEEAS